MATLSPLVDVSDISVFHDEDADNSTNLCEDNIVEIEGDGFILPPGNVSVKIEDTGKRFPKLSSVSSHPPYLHTCYDEFTRQFIVTSIAPDAADPSFESLLVSNPPPRFPDLDVLVSNNSVSTTAETSSSQGKGTSSESAKNSVAFPVATYGTISKPQLPSPMRLLDLGSQIASKSTFRMTPPDSRHLLGRRPDSDTNILLRFLSCRTQYEPLFISFALFWVSPDHTCRVSESFRVDMSSKEISRKYAHIYFMMEKDEASRPTSDGKTVAKQKTDPVTVVKSCMFNIPDKGIKKSEIFLVGIVTKVLTGDNPCAPYARSAYGGGGQTGAADVKHEETCKRLRFYRQQVGVGVVRLYNDAGNFENSDVKMQIHATKYNTNDGHIGQHIREMYFERAGRSSLEALDLDVQLTLLDLKRDRDLVQTLAHGKLHLVQAQGIVAHILPSQFNSASEFAASHSWEGEPLQNENALSRTIRRVQYLHPIQTGVLIAPQPNTSSSVSVSSSTQSAVLAALSSAAANTNTAGNRSSVQFQLETSLSLRRQIRTGVDNTLYVYLNMLERFQNRNLCVKVQLIEFVDDIVSGVPDLKDAYTTLPNMYNTIPGSLFCSALFSTVWYHNYSPVTCDEFKIRLPDVVTSRHWLKFTVQNITVKEDRGTRNRQSYLKPFLGASLFSSQEGDKEVETEATAVVLGTGFLPLLARSESSDADVDALPLLPDKEHIIHILTDAEPVEGVVDRRKSSSSSSSLASGKRRQSTSGSDAAATPFLRVSTRSISSFASTCPRVQAALTYSPVPLGHFPSSNPKATAFDLGCEYTRNEKLVTKAIQELEHASTEEMTNHFLVLFRHLCRAVCAGNGIYDVAHINPYRHNQLRSTAFVMLLQLFGRLVAKTDRDDASNSELLLAVIEFLFDEEMPVAQYEVQTNWSTTVHQKIAEEAAEKVRSKKSLYSIDNVSSSPVDSNLDYIHESESDEGIDDSFMDKFELTEGSDAGSKQADDHVLDRTDLDYTVQQQFNGEEDCVTAESESLGSPQPGALPKSNSYASNDSATDDAGDRDREGGEDDVDADEEERSLSTRKSMRAKDEMEAVSIDLMDVSFGNGLGTADDIDIEEPQVTANGQAVGTPSEGRPEAVDADAGATDDFDPQSDPKCTSSKIIISKDGAFLKTPVRTVTLVAKDDASSPAMTGNSESYVDYLASHSLNQALRLTAEIVIDELLALVVQDYCSDSDVIPELEASLDATMGLRWWSLIGITGDRQEPSSSSEDDRDATMSSSNISAYSPFDPESYWFDIHHEDENSLLFKTSNIPIVRSFSSSLLYSVSPMLSRKKSKFEELLFSQLSPPRPSGPGFGLPDVAQQYLSSDDVEVVESSFLQSRTAIVIQTPFVECQSLPGFVEREGRIVSASSVMKCASATAQERQRGIDEGSPSPFSSVSSGAPSAAVESNADDGRIYLNKTSTPIHIRWWPWMYEVLTSEWAALLNIANESSDPVNKYPFQVTDIPNHPTLRYRNTSMLAVDNAPILLRMVLKSLIFRVNQCKKSMPVVLDSQCMHCFQMLVHSLARNSKESPVGPDSALAVTAALAAFFRNLFALVVPHQVYVLVREYFSVIEQIPQERQLTMQMLQDLCQYDHFIAVNAPLTPDAHKDLIGTYVSQLDPKLLHEVRAQYYVGGEPVLPPPHWLSDIVIRNCLRVYRLPDSKPIQKKMPLAILQDLLRRLAFDVRYKQKTEKQRIAILFWPLVSEFLSDIDALSRMPSDSADRKQILSIILTLFQDIPDDIFRDQIRKIFQLSPLFSEALVFPAMINDSFKSSTEQPTTPGQPGPPSVGRPPVLSARLIAVSRSNSLVDSINVASSSPISHVPSPPTPSMHSATSKVAEAAAVSSSHGIWSLIHLAHLSLESFSASVLLNESTPAQDRVGNFRKAVESKYTQEVKPYFQRSKQASDAETLKPAEKTNVIKTASLSATMTVIKSIRFILEECTRPAFDDAFVATATSSAPEASGVEPQTPCYNHRQFEGLVAACLHVILHGLGSCQAESAVEALFNLATWIVRRIGAKLFLHSVGDSLQDWLRVTFRALSYCTSNSPAQPNAPTEAASSEKDKIREGFLTAAVSIASMNFMTTLCKAQFVYFGSLTIISDTALAVFSDVIEGVLDWFGTRPRTHESEDRLLYPLLANIKKIRLTSSKLLTAGRCRLSPFYYALTELCSNLELLMTANAHLRRHVSDPTGYDWQGCNMLDGPYSDAVNQTLLSLRQKRRLCPPAAPAATAAKAKVFVEEVMEMFLLASEVFDPIRLPRQRIYWLECLAKYHLQLKNRAEAAEIRWQIFNICLGVHHTWQKQWAPRQPLQWSSSKQGAPGSQAQNASSFLVNLAKAVRGPCNRPWASVEQHTSHKVVTLTESAAKFAGANMCYLAERAHRQLIDLHRLAGRVDLIHLEFEKMSAMFRTQPPVSSDATETLGQFFYVQYIGSGIPVHLQKDFIYRVQTKTLISEFGALLSTQLSALVAPGVTVNVVNNKVAITTKDRQSADAMIFLMAVEAVSKGSQTNAPISLATITPNQVQQFKFTVPYTPNDQESRRKSEVWKQSIILTVPHAFPYCYNRQPVVYKEVRTLSPVNIAVDALEGGIAQMKKRISSTSPGDFYDFTGFVQRCQTVAGTIENAKKLLPPVKVPSTRYSVNSRRVGVEKKKASYRQSLIKLEPTAAISIGIFQSPAVEDESTISPFQHKLKMTLLEYVACCKSVVAYSKKVFPADAIVDDLSGGGSSTSQEASSAARGKRDAKAYPMSNQSSSDTAPRVSLWLGEMDKGYDSLLAFVMPAIADLPNAHKLNR